MSKYEPLADHLRGSGQTALPMTFSEIEKIIGSGLPASAFRHRAWWSNNPSNSVITYAWLKAGYKTAKVDMPGRRLVFCKAAQAGPLLQAENGPPTVPIDGPPARADAEASEPAAAGFFQRIFGSLKGTVTVKPGTDLTEPVETEWDAGR